MSFLPRFNFTIAMVRNLGIIESARAVIDILSLPPDRVLSLRQAARRRATRNSTGIEGNTLNGVEIDRRWFPSAKPTRGPPPACSQVGGRI